MAKWNISNPNENASEKQVRNILSVSGLYSAKTAICLVQRACVFVSYLWPAQAKAMSQLFWQRFDALGGNNKTNNRNNNSSPDDNAAATVWKPMK